MYAKAMRKSVACVRTRPCCGRRMDSEGDKRPGHMGLGGDPRVRSLAFIRRAAGSL